MEREMAKHHQKGNPITMSNIHLIKYIRMSMEYDMHDGGPPSERARPLRRTVLEKSFERLA